MGTRDEALITLALRTGMRQDELAALRWEDIELGKNGDKPTITVRRSADTRTSKVRISTTRTGRERRISIGPRTIEVLNSHRARQLKERMAATTWTDAGLGRGPRLPKRARLGAPARVGSALT
jgi:integrase